MLYGCNKHKSDDDNENPNLLTLSVAIDNFFLNVGDTIIIELSLSDADEDLSIFYKL